MAIFFLAPFIQQETFLSHEHMALHTKFCSDNLRIPFTQKIAMMTYTSESTIRKIRTCSFCWYKDELWMAKNARTTASWKNGESVACLQVLCVVFLSS